MIITTNIHNSDLNANDILILHLNKNRKSWQRS